IFAIAGDRKNIDFGGCRCQAFLLTGKSSATDPTCHLSPHHQLIIEARELDLAADYIDKTIQH
ncbi:MAG: hypothetical protein AAFS12_17345, partial [Cyanobacteria bacterium J06632_19]